MNVCRPPHVPQCHPCRPGRRVRQPFLWHAVAGRPQTAPLSCLLRWLRCCIPCCLAPPSLQDGTQPQQPPAWPVAFADGIPCAVPLPGFLARLPTQNNNPRSRLQASRRALWAMPVAQVGFLAFFLLDAIHHWWYDAWLLVPCFVTGALHRRRRFWCTDRRGWAWDAWRRGFVSVVRI